MSKAILIENGTLVDGKGNPPMAGDLLMEGDRIKAVGPDASAALANDAEVERIDATGKTVMPGLIDAHCHITFDEPMSNDELFFHRREALAALIAGYNVKKLLLAGVTSFFDADSIFEIGIDLRDALEAGIVPGPRMSTGGNALLTSVGGTAGRLFADQGRTGYAMMTRTRDEIIAEVRREIKNGVDWIKVHVTGIVPRQRAKGELQVWSFDELRTVCDAAHELGIPVVGHCRGSKATKEAAEAGFDMILHATLMEEDALEAVIERKVPIVPTFTFQANLADFGHKVGAGAELAEIFKREIEDSSVSLRRAYEAGVPMICGSESGFSITPYGDWHWREMEVFVNHMGMTPLQAIQCGTQAGAFAMKMEGQVGELTEGALADVIVVDGDVVKDLSVLGDHRNIHHVFVGGQAQDLTPQPQRKPISGWRVSPYSSAILSRENIGFEG